MSIIVEFFVAPSHEAAAAVVDRGPDGVFESAVYGNFVVEMALIEWESIFTGRSYEELLADDEPEAVAGPGEAVGPRVVVASRALQDALATADQSRIIEASRLWVQERAADGDELDQEIATAILSDLARLARGIDGRDHRLYCWTC